MGEEEIKSCAEQVDIVFLICLSDKRRFVG